MNSASLLGHATELLSLTESSRSPADAVTGSFFRDRHYLGSKDRRWIAERVYGLIRHRRYAEALLERYLDEHPGHDELNGVRVRFLPLLLILLVTQSEPQALEYGASTWKTLFPAISLEQFGAWIGTNAGLTFLGGDEQVLLGVKHSFQDWMVAGWLETFGAATGPLLRALNTQAPTALRVNLLKTTRAQCAARLREEGVETSEGSLSESALIASKRFNLQGSPVFRDGWMELQDEGSQLVSVIASPRPGSLVVDACAGAGGKTLHLAEIMNNSGDLVAMDADTSRLDELDRRARRGGFTCIRIARSPSSDRAGMEGKADLVLVDAPCTGVGTIRRNPGLKWSVTEVSAERHAARQSEILRANAPLVRPGGRLVYVTCSLLRKENDDVVESFLRSHPGFAPDETVSRPPPPVPDLPAGIVRLLPHVHGTDGFFIAVLKRVS